MKKGEKDENEIYQEKILLNQMGNTACIEKF